MKRRLSLLVLLIIVFLSGCLNENNIPPSKALEVYPINHSTNIPLKITLKWEGYDEENGTNLNYDVYLGKNKENLNLMENKTAKTKYQVIGLEPNTTYYWKIDSIDSKGAKTEGEIWEFTTKENTPPSSPNLIEPENNATNVSLNPTLKWNVTDLDGHELKYDIYFGTDINNLNLIVENYTDTSYPLNGLDPNTKYYWKIIAKDKYNGKTEGEIWEFTTKENTPSLSPNLIEPENNATNVSLDPTLKWNVTDLDGHELKYDIYFGTDINKLELIAENYTDTSYPLNGLDPNTTYYWKIIVKDNNGNSTSGSIWSFTTRKENVNKNIIAVAAGIEGLLIIDISDPYNPEQIGHYDTKWANGVYVKDNLAFVADSSNGLVIIDISDPANPVLEYDMLWFFAYGVSGY